MKKIVGYAVVGVLSAGITLGAYKGFLEEQPNNQNVNETETGLVTTSVNYDLPNVFGKPTSSNNPADFTKAASKTVNAVVNVKNYSNRQQQQYIDPFDFFFGGGQQQQQQQDGEPQKMGHGSGVVISANGYIVTNNHVIEKADRIEVTLNDQRTYDAELVGTDPSSDIALLKIDEKGLPFLPFSNSDNLKVGEWVLAVGNPYSLNSTVTAGIVSAVGRSLNLNPVESFIQTDAAINPGNSGGALVNTDGDLVGINSAISSRTGSYIGYGFAVPTNMVKKIVEDIKKYGFVQRGLIGVTPIDLSDEDIVSRYNKQFNENIAVQKGVLIYDMDENGAALEAGLEKGDIIKKIDNQKITNNASLIGYLNSKHPGDTVKITVNRNGKEKVYNVVLRDKHGVAKMRSKDELTVSEVLGAELAEAPEKFRKRYGIDFGVQITKLNSGKINQVQGLTTGCVILAINQKKVSTPKDVDKILKGYKGEVSMVFLDKYGRKIYGGFEMD
ncbi:MAG: S1C family serine protease [Flavobacteriales bacterium]